MGIKTDEKIRKEVNELSSQTESEDAIGVWKDCNDEMWNNMSDEERKD